MTSKRSNEGVGRLFPLDPSEEIKTVSPTLPSDQAQRERASDTTRSYVVEAPAGSGKTGLLIQRYLKLLTLPDVESPEQVLAITFTIKAAGEIRDRILRQLENASSVMESDLPAFELETRKLAKKVLERDKQLGWELLDNPRRMNLRTIDSICAEIARGLPILSGGSGLKPVDDAASLHRLAAERTLLQLGGANRKLSEAIGTVLLHRDGDLQLCQSLLADMLALRDQWGRLIPLDPESFDDATLDSVVLPKLETILASAIGDELSELDRAFPQSTLEQLATLAAELGSLPGYEGVDSPVAICAGRFAIPKPTAEDVEIWRAFAHLLLVGKGDNWRKGFNANYMGFKLAKLQRESLEEIIGRLKTNDKLLALLEQVKFIPPAVYPVRQWRVAKALFLVLHYALIELQFVFAERGECDFTELGLLARGALRHESGSIDTAIGDQLQHILVDEMQDTSTSQYELIDLLTQGWDGHSQTVFLVGDPKQSIYLFRQARVERFVRMMKEQRIGELGLDLLHLQANFRSQPELVRDFNKTFSSVFSVAHDENSRDEVAYVEAEPIRSKEGSPERGAIWHPQVISNGSKEETPSQARWFAQKEASQIRTIIESWRARPLPFQRNEPWKIAVLVRNRSHLKQIVAELKHAGGAGPIPFRAVDIEPLAERPEVLDLFALTRALVHPADRVAWLAVLRAPWCGLELADMHLLSGQDDHAYEAHTVIELMRERAALLSSDGRSLLARVGPVLEAARAKYSRIPLSELVERTWRTLGGYDYLKEEERQNSGQFFILLDQLEQNDSPLNVEAIHQRLQRLYAAPSKQENAVDLLTIHGAKGLEWDVVLVPGLEKRSPNDGQRLLAWEELNLYGETVSSVLLAPISEKGEDTESLNIWIRKIHSRREEAECKRLFYVACTRAREELHLFATLKQRADGSIHPSGGTLLNAAWPAAEGQFVDVDVAAKPLIAPVIPFPAADEVRVLPSIAAEGMKRPSLALTERLPVNWLSPHVASSLRHERVRPKKPGFERPEGSSQARVFGNVVHSLMELMARRISYGVSVNELLTEVKGWQPRIIALLRSRGLSSEAIQRFSVQAQTALLATLADEDGRWILRSHKDSYNEYALTSGSEELSSVRMDRIFRAGASPQDDGDSHLWIIDFKTTQYTGTRLAEFLENERRKYSGQMEAYAQIVRSANADQSIRLGLYYPLLPKLIWWAAD